MEQDYACKAFISCSLRPDDEKYVNVVENILRQLNILPFGTVGRHSASPQNPTDLMKTNIKEADMVVIVATPRYNQTDVHNGNSKTGLSEMIQVESGMASITEKPIVVFSFENCDVGNFLPNVTQYINLEYTQEDLNKKWPLIHSLLDSAYNTAKEKLEESSKSSFSVSNLAKTGLMLYGGFKLFQTILKATETKKIES